MSTAIRRAVVRQVDLGTLCVELESGPRYCAAACTHRGGRLLHGKVDRSRGLLVCPLHGSSFNLFTGAAKGVAEEPLWVGDEATHPSNE